MLDKLTQTLQYHGTALQLRAERQRIIAGNIANADTPNYVARDFKFSEALRAATEPGSFNRLGNDGTDHRTHIPLSRSLDDEKSKLGYAVQAQPNMDRNTVDMDRERANFADNAVRFEATLRFINGNAKTMLSAIQGQ